MGEEKLSPKMQQILDYLTDSLMLSTPLINNDPAYQQLKDNIPSIISMASMSLGKEDVEDLTAQETYVASLKSLQIIYLRLATSVAPEFDVSAEQVSFKRGDRFFHYTSLAENVASTLASVDFDTVEIADVRISTRNGTLRNYNISLNQKVNLQLNTITQTSVELEWKMFNLSYGEFYKYTLMYSEAPIYDEYSVPMIREGKDIVVKDLYNIKRIKYRIMDLTPGTKYYLVMVLHSRAGNKSIEQVEFETLPEEEEDNG